jgi:aconitate hydratase
VLTVTRCCARRASSGSSSSSSAPASPRCRSPTARRSRTWRPSTARRWASSRSTPRRSLPALHRPREELVELVEATARRRACSAPTPTPDPELHRHARARPRRRRAEHRRPKRPQDRVAAPRGETVPRAPLRRRAKRARLRRRRRDRRRTGVDGIGEDLTLRTAPSSSPRSRAARTPRTPSRDARRRPAREEGRRARPDVPKPWVKTSLAPGSKVVTDYLDGRPRPTSSSSALPRRLRLHDLHRQQRPAARADREGDQGGRPRRRAVLSGNRNFEGRVHPARARRTTSLAAARRRLRARRHVDIDLDDRAARHGPRRQARLPEGHLADAAGDRATVASRERPAMFARATPTSSRATRVARLESRPPATLFAWDPSHLHPQAAVLRRHAARGARAPLADIEGARVLALLGDSVTTDHISPAGNIAKTARPEVPRRARRRPRTSTPTARAAATTR